jgi:hypothetical protein
MQTVTIAAPLCAPSRAALTDTVRRQLAPYKFRLGNTSAEILQQNGVPQCWQIRVDFSNDAARWGEYVLLRYGYQRIGAYIDPRNERWAARHIAKPSPGPWYAPDCRDRPRQAGLVGEIRDANPPPPWSQRAGSRFDSALHRRRSAGRSPLDLLDLIDSLIDRF